MKMEDQMLAVVRDDGDFDSAGAPDEVRFVPDLCADESAEPTDLSAKPDVAGRTEFYDWNRNGRLNGHRNVEPPPDEESRQIRNWQLVVVPDDDVGDEQADDEGAGEEKKKRKPIYVPMPMAGVLQTIRKATGDWPRRVGQWLFAHEAENEISWLESTAATFGYLQSKTGIVPWRKGTGYVTQEQTAAELARTATNYIAIERFPHWPAIKGHYYACKTPRAGDGSTLNALIDRFCPSTQIDRDLFLAMFVTPGWGGPGGCRPAFLLTSTAGRGAGKSKNASMVGHLWDGLLDFHQNEDLTTIKQRMLSPDGLASRVAMLDNVKSLRFSWAELESLITIPTVSGKRMYVGEGSRPNTLTWLLTLNGASLSTDMAQRVVIIQIDKPKRSGSWEEDTIAFIQQNRPAILADVAAFFEREPCPPRLFSRWASWERDVLSRLPEPEDAQKVILERQGNVDVEQEEADILRDFFSAQLDQLSYDVERSWVHIPSAVAGAWYNAAVNERHKIPGAARILKQLCEEGRIKWLSVNPSRTHGRGFTWMGQESEVDAATIYDLETRLAAQRKGYSTAG